MSDFRFSTGDYQQTDSIAVWREIFGQKIANLDMEPIAGQPFRGEVFVRTLPDLTIGLTASSPNRIKRTRALIADGNDDVMLGIMLTGRATIFQQNFGEVSVDTGDAVVWSNATPGHSHYSEPIEFLSIAIPRSALLPHLLHPDNAAPAIVPASNKVLRLLVLYVQAMQRTSMPQGLQSVAAMHVRDLVATMLGPTADAAHLAARRGVSNARLRAIKVDIAANFSRPDLTIGAISARHGMSPRTIGALFNREGTTFTDFVLEQRLAQVHRMLVDPRFADRTISSLALESGFGDISYFNNAFRRRYAATPSDVRAAAGPRG
ncbi:MAG: AraC family transcriptional regulator [Bauldia sp.]